MTIRPKHTPKTQVHTRFSKNCPRSRIFSLFSNSLLLRRMQTHFELFILIQCIILIHGTRVILSVFPHSRVLRKCYIAISPENYGNASILKSQHHLNKSHIFSTSFARCFCQSLNFSQLGSDSRQARLTFYG